MLAELHGCVEALVKTFPELEGNLRPKLTKASAVSDQLIDIKCGLSAALDKFIAESNQ